jgi:hypothetical protein
MDSWVLTFPRARLVYDQIMTERIWSNPAARAELKTLLSRNGMLTPGTQSFGSFSSPVPTQHADNINFRPIDMNLTALDDMDAALGRFTFRVLVSGTVTTTRAAPGTPSRHAVSIAEIGVYVRDSFDFNGDQHLGFWNDTTNEVSSINPFTGDRVTNESFRAWRTSSGRGGDFIVYSDLKRTPLSTPDTFLLP